MVGGTTGAYEYGPYDPEIAPYDGREAAYAPGVR
jgi:hypothetical protein